MYVGTFLCTFSWTWVTLRVGQFQARTTGTSSTLLPAYRRNFITYQAATTMQALVVLLLVNE